MGGGTLLGLAVVGRLALEGFWLGPAQLRPSEPFGRWSVPVIMVSTAFPNLLVVPGHAWRVLSHGAPHWS